MSLLNKIIIKNFKSFREKRVLSLFDANYFVGANNSGKSTILEALRFFFDDDFFKDISFVNRTSFLSKKAGSNVVEISIDFNLEALTTKKLKAELIKQYDSNLLISKIVSVTTDTKIISISYKIANKAVDKLPDDVYKMIKSVKLTYLHPQDGQILLLNAQEKLRQRLLANWGRGSNITQSIKSLQTAWDDLRQKSKIYLSGALTESLQEMWPDSEVTINLPKDIRDIIAVSDINFSGYKNTPEIELTSQGTGAQSTILYLTHFLLDSDRSLHRGEYHPLWLLEEPESFLHIDLLSNLAKQLNSEKWLDNIQMLISTHSPVLLAGSKIAAKKAGWSVLNNQNIIYNKTTNDFQDSEVKEIGKIMGDPNFFVYFLAAQNDKLIFIEDKKNLTLEKYREAGISVTRGLNGTSEVAKFIDVYVSTPTILNSKTFFLIDADKGATDLSRFYDVDKLDVTYSGFNRYKVKDSGSIYLVFLPKDFSSEDLFVEFKNHLEECVSKVWDTKTYSILDDVPSNLSSLVSKCRREKVVNLSEAINLIKNNDDVKNLFWNKVSKFNYKISKDFADTLIKITK